MATDYIPGQSSHSHKWHEGIETSDAARVQEIAGRAIVGQSLKNKDKGYEVPVKTRSSPKLDLDVINNALEGKVK